MQTAPLLRHFYELTEWPASQGKLSCEPAAKPYPDHLVKDQSAHAPSALPLCWPDYNK